MDSLKLVITDVDGSLTDGGVYYFEDGSKARKFSTLDGAGFALLREAGILVIMLSSSDSSEIVHRANWLGVPFFGGVVDKGAWMIDHFESYSISEENVAMFGNDVNDLPVMQLSGFPGCPQDAHNEVWYYCFKNGIICDSNGGHGAFREFADMILGSRNN